MEKNKEVNILTEEDIKPENIKVSITIRIAGDLLDMYKAEADRLGIGYQTLMQMKLKEAIESKSLETRIAALEDVVRPEPKRAKEQTIFYDKVNVNDRVRNPRSAASAAKAESIKGRIVMEKKSGRMMAGKKKHSGR